MMNLFPGLSSCSLMLMISLWQEFLRWENWATEKLNMCLVVLNSLTAADLVPVTAVSTQNSQTSILLWRVKSQVSARHPFFQWTYNTSDTHMHKYTLTYTCLLQSEVLEQTQIQSSIFSSLKK